MSETITCYNCEEEFKVESVFETDQEVMFCPYCGSDLDIDEDYDELDDEYDEDNRD